MTNDEADRAALRELVEAYASCADGRDGPGFAELFTLDAVLTTHDPSGAVGSRYAGRHEMATIPGKLDRYDTTTHLVLSTEFVLDGDSATGLTACEAHHVRGASDRVLTIRYVDSFRREERWRFTSRQVRVDEIEDRPIDG